MKCITLRDPATGATARVAPERGFNCYSFQPVVEGQRMEVLWTADDFLSGQARASSSGIPILFPFPGRLRGKTFCFGGETFELAEYQDALGNAIHGMVLERPWQVVEQSAAQVVGRFELRQPPHQRRWPADFRLTADYCLEGNTLWSQFTIENIDTRPLPWGLGTHPYFRLPLGAAGTADQCIVTIPCQGYWELKDMLPTGNKLPVDVRRALAAGSEFRGLQLDDVLTDLQGRGGRIEASILDPVNGRRLVVRFDEVFTQCVAYTPGHRQAICIEPYTCVPGLAAEAGSQPGQSLAALPPGGVVRAAVEMALQPTEA